MPIPKKICNKVKENYEKCTAVHLKLGEYWKNLQRRSTASGGKRFWKTWKEQTHDFCAVRTVPEGSKTKKMISKAKF